MKKKGSQKKVNWGEMGENSRKRGSEGKKRLADDSGKKRVLKGGER